MRFSTGNLGRLLPVLGVNAVPVVGVFLEEWSAATALSLYWCENVLGSLLVALRIVIHQVVTRKRGHRRQQISLEAHQHTGKLPGSFLGEFARITIGATVLHGLLLWFLVRKVLDTAPELAEVRNGVLFMAAFQLLGFAMDLVGIRQRPFAWVRELAGSSVRRVNLIHLTLIVGTFTLSGDGEVDFFGPFTLLKTLADVGGVLAAAFGARADPHEAPRWLMAVMNCLGCGAEFAKYWRGIREDERKLFEEDEEVVPATRSARRRRR